MQLSRAIFDAFAANQFPEQKQDIFVDFHLYNYMWENFLNKKLIGE